MKYSIVDLLNSTGMVNIVNRPGKAGEKKNGTNLDMKIAVNINPRRSCDIDILYVCSDQ